MKPGKGSRVLGLVVALAGLLAAQGAVSGNGLEALLAAYQGQQVTAVELVGWPGLATGPVLAQLPQKAGEALQPDLVNASLARLRAILTAPGAAGRGLAPGGRKLSAVEAQVTPEVGGLRVQFVLEPADYVGVYQFPGAERFSYSRLLEAAAYQSRAPYSQSAEAAGVAGLQAFFQQQGYFTATVTPRVEAGPPGLVNIVFATQLGPLAKFGTVTFAGASAAQTARWRGVLGSWRARLKRAAVRPGKGYSFSTLQNASTYLQSWLNGQGHLGAQIGLGGATYHRATNRADIRFTAAPGPVVEIKVAGAHLWPWTRRGLLPIYQESRVDPELIQEGQDNLVNYFSAKGYFSAAVTTTVTSADGTRRVTRATAADEANSAAVAAGGTPKAATTVVYQIVKGPRHDVEEVRFSGNKFYSEDELRPLVKLQSEHFLSHGAFNQQLLRTSVDNITALYQLAGYSSVRVTPKVTRPDGNVVVDFQITEGPQDYVQSLKFEGNTLAPGVLAPNGLMVGPGAPFSQRLIGQDRAQVLAQYLSRGYLNATFRATAQAVAGQPHEIAVVYQIHEGPQVRTGSIETAGRVQTQQRYVNMLTDNLRPESFLTENAMLTAESRLYGPGIFDWTEVGPRRPVTDQNQSDVVIKVHEGPRNTLTWGFGFDVTNRGGTLPSGTVALPGLPVVGLPSSFKTSQSRFLGPSANIEYTRTNLFGKAETVSVGGFAGRLDQRMSANYTDPNLNWSKYAASLQLSAEHDETNPIFTAKEAQVGYQLERALNPDQTTNLFLRYSFSETKLSHLLIPDLVPAKDLSTRLSTLSVTVLRDTRDNPLDAHKGFLESYELDYNPKLLGSSVNFTKFNSQTAYYRQVKWDMVWANSVRFGFEHAFGNSFVPLSQAFFSGGANTLRGFPLNGAGPQRTLPACGDPNDPATCSLIQVPLGGRALFIVNSELRIPVPEINSNLGFVVFYDGGNVFSHLGFSNLGASYTNSVGLGLRFKTPVGPIRLDVGHNLSPIEGIQPTQIFITLGQAF